MNDAPFGLPSDAEDRSPRSPSPRDMPPRDQSSRKMPLRDLAPRSLVLRDLALLVLRLGFGGFMVYGHGWRKLMSFGKLSESFADPLGVGSQASLAMAVFAEVGCAILLLLGLATRLAVLPLIATMSMAAFVVHGADPFSSKELALVYLTAYTAILLAGPGRYSIDALITRFAAARGGHG